MIDIREYENKQTSVIISTVDGEQFTGRVVCIDDADEEEPEDSITIETINGRIIGLYPSEIKSIKEL